MLRPERSLPETAHCGLVRNSVRKKLAAAGTNSWDTTVTMAGALDASSGDAGVKSAPSKTSFQKLFWEELIKKTEPTVPKTRCD